MTTQTPTGNLFVVAAPSGAGKTSLVQAVANATDGVKISISHTTRPKRANEEHGKNYYFTAQDEFEGMIQRGEFLEHAEVFGCYYGTSQRWVAQQLESGSDVILEIDWQGAAQIRQVFPSSVSIFILPPSMDVLRQRLQGRSQDSAQVIERRLAEAAHEISHCGEFDYLMVNDDFDEAAKELQAIILAKRLGEKVFPKKHGQLLVNLLKDQ